nr:hypothetical protein [uncultured Caulobacter sp.]
MFKKLFGEPAKVAPEVDDDLKFVTKRSARVHSRDLYGQFAKSPNGRFVLVWSDADPDAHRSGPREDGPGRYVLLDGGQVIAEGRLERPHDGRVANTGVFVLNDWMFGQGLLCGRVCAFAADGRALVAHTVEANLYNNGLSPDGAYAVAQTANAPNADGNQLFVFDLAAGALITRFSPEIGWADTYKFDAKTRTLRLRQRDGGEFAFGFDGTFIDREAWIEHGLAAGKPMVLETLLREAGGKVDAALARRWKDGLARAMANPDLHPAYKARLLRYGAEGYEADGDIAAALTAYEAAVAADPKLGVKRKIAQLRQQLDA